VLAHGPHEQIRLDAVEEGPDIKIKNPGMAPAPLPRHDDRIERRFPGPVAVGILVELRLRISLNWDSVFRKSRTSVSLSRGQRI
jgi:hypothetical protein